MGSSLKQMKFSNIISESDCLFRYRSVNENNLEALNNDRLYFSTPACFNDPYDNLIFVNTQTVLSKIIGSIHAGMDSYLAKNIDKMPEIAFFKNVWDDKQVRPQLLQQHCERIASALDAVRMNLRANPRLICFSEEYDSMLMWSHYADYHKGYVLVYAKNDLVSSNSYDNKGNLLSLKTRLEKVQYTDRQTDMTDEVLAYLRVNMLGGTVDNRTDASISPAKLREVLTEKSTDWQYEKEWRLIPHIPSIEKPSQFSYLICKPKAVIIGSKCIETHRKQLIDICEKMQIPVFGIFLSETDSSYRLLVDEDGNTEVSSPVFQWIYRK